eukprot:c7839_g1_i1.p1 GENE.c7839_g1_i1~~c7839_g1_i1.p1  ORF type:complete len:234 (-),score=20.23 c7839_g1_i1:90-791(-)
MGEGFHSRTMGRGSVLVACGASFTMSMVLFVLSFVNPHGKAQSLAFCHQETIQLISPFYYTCLPEAVAKQEGGTTETAVVRDRFSCPWPVGNQAFRCVLSFVSAIMSLFIVLSVCRNVFKKWGPWAVWGLAVAAFSMGCVDADSVMVGHGLCSKRFTFTTEPIIPLEGCGGFKCNSQPYVALVFADWALSLFLVVMAHYTASLMANTTVLEVDEEEKRLERFKRSRRSRVPAD